MISTSQETHDRIAHIVLQGFDRYRSKFRKITSGARARFENADWYAAQKAAADRINLYDLAVSDVVDLIQCSVSSSILKPDNWPMVKQCYIQQIMGRTDYELAETFFNSIYCRLFKHQVMEHEGMFIHTSLPGVKSKTGIPITNIYALGGEGLVGLLDEILDDHIFTLPWENKRRDIRNIIKHLELTLPRAVWRSNQVKVEVLNSVFYRNKASYLVGRIESEGMIIPFVLAIMNNEKGRVYIDTLLMDRDDVSILFSFTRSYFLVDVPVPAEYVRFLQALMPSKSEAELYSSIGFFKHGKTEFYREFLRHLDTSADEFVSAPGIKGMVMAVFTLPSYPVVFKIIKDYFAPPKEVSRVTVMEKYELVKRHDRVGRMADTQEFSNFVFPRHRFADSLLQELQEVAASNLIIDEHTVTIRHLYTERRMTPLNLYLQSCTEKQCLDVLDEYGNALKQLAAANIFAGDMLLKNFGVTRHGRVVFYDYDEISYLTEVNFRAIPEAAYPEQEMSGEPWYSVGPNDVFPEEFPRFLFADVRIRKLFNDMHGNLFTPEYWQGLQAAIREGRVMSVYPYRRKKRFPRNELAASEQLE
ncbi:bifunctional isocitrate dehydrogenase kinase/phosphatase [Pokkaliibacter plantistimulans]|uniref:Isocitrate dehydrogenase kinase/phosphatase n=1 Tax=Proteobacteria bacterium 228 TaxID=2083153 RepID=A0A2S5KRN0_9PROT|nr:bifunctional isocitrate dehydrogenase kinase/phosphatase [Pokkaliibacter plantistimulans]PPC77363.1 bifunctional isocitrate dehydrogenase kinase/phosphatase [Pokkaliibacter plantistimulans]